MLKLNHRIMFLRNKSGMPVGCVALRKTRNTNEVEYQLSVLNPIDRFDRKVARQLALGRLVEKPVVVSVKGEMNMHNISMAVMEDVARGEDNVPARAVKAAKLWLMNKPN